MIDTPQIIPFTSDHTPTHQNNSLTQANILSDDDNSIISLLPKNSDISDHSSSTTNSSDSTYTSSSSSSPSTSTYHTPNKTKSPKLIHDKVCTQALNMIKFLGTLNMKKIDLKHEPRQRRYAFMEWISQLEIAFSSNKYTRNILQNYSSKNKINDTSSKLVDILIYTARSLLK